MTLGSRDSQASHHLLTRLTTQEAITLAHSSPSGPCPCTPPQEPLSRLHRASRSSQEDEEKQPSDQEQDHGARARQGHHIIRRTRRGGASIIMARTLQAAGASAPSHARAARHPRGGQSARALLPHQRGEPLDASLRTISQELASQERVAIIIRSHHRTEVKRNSANSSRSKLPRNDHTEQSGGGEPPCTSRAINQEARVPVTSGSSPCIRRLTS